MNISEIIKLFSGIALFLFGMTLMGDGLKKVAGNKLEIILYRLSSTPVRGLLLGTGVTAVIQSSCATSIMVVGFVNAGMMKLRQSISVIIGAILGTSVTGWVICLSYIEGASGWKSLLSTATLTGAIAVVGIILFMFSKSQLKQNIGGILMGFAVLMFGMSAMSSAVSPLGEAEWFTSFLSTLSNPFLGIIVGTIFTAILQSASAAVGVIQALAVTGAMGVSQSLPLLMGVALGASAPVIISAIGAGTQGKRSAFVYPITSLIGVAFSGAIFYALDAVFDFSFMSMTVSPFSVAAVNSFLRIVMAVFMVATIPLTEKLTILLVKEKSTNDDTIALEERFLSYPALAVEQSRMAITEMFKDARKAVAIAIRLLKDFSADECRKVQKIEEDVDRYEDTIGSYLMKLTLKELTPKQNSDVTKYVHTLTDFERISDHALNIALVLKELHEKGADFSSEASADIDVLAASVNEIMHQSVRAFEQNDPQRAKKVEPLKEHIDELCALAKRRHIDRLKAGACKPLQGFTFNDLLTNFSRIAGHCSNVAIAVIELQELSGENQEFIQHADLHESAEYKEYYADYESRYKLESR